MEVCGDEIQWKVWLCSLTGTRLLYIQWCVTTKKIFSDKVNHAIIGIREEIKQDADLAIAFENRSLESVKNEKGRYQS